MSEVLRDAAERLAAAAEDFLTIYRKKYANAYGRVRENAPMRVQAAGLASALPELKAALAVPGGDGVAKLARETLDRICRGDLDPRKAAVELFGKFDQDDITAILERAASAPAPAGPGWRPISTAPRDGSRMLACSVNHDAVEVVCWQEGEEPGWVNDGPIKDRMWANPRWFTHWMPLPASPAPQGGGHDA